MKKDLKVIRRGVEFVTVNLIVQIEKLRKQYTHIAIGVYTDELFEKILGRPPIKPYEERVRLASSLKGVDYVFKAKCLEEEDGEQLEQPIYNGLDESPKMFSVAYVPGTYDLLHEGHIQHLLICRNLCDVLVVGVNTDKLVYENKGKHPKMTQEERATIIKNLKFVDLVYIVKTNSKQEANNWVQKQLNGKGIDVILLGSDLKGQNHDNPENIPVLYTYRDVDFMKTHSSTFLRAEISKILSDFLGE